MITECNIILNNGLNMVVNFNGKEIQLPSVNSKNKTCFVRQDKGFYSVVSKDEFEKLSTKTKKSDKKGSVKPIVITENETEDKYMSEIDGDNNSFI